jgi:O-antigen/teichoic acid export membrane protein
MNRSHLIRERVLTAAMASWIAKLIAVVTGFLATPFILHRLGDTRYGIYILVGSIIVQGAHLDLGIRSAVTKFVAEHHARAEFVHLRSLIATALWLYCFLAVIALLLTVVIAPVLPSLFNVPETERNTLVTVTLLMGAQLAISIPGAIPSAILAGLQKFVLSNTISTAWTLASTAITVIILLAGGGLIEIATAGIPLALFMQSLMAFCVFRIAPDLRVSWRGAQRSLVKTVLSFSASMFIIDVSYSLQTKIDEIIVGVFLPVSLVSPYSIARRLSGVPQLVAERFLSAFLPLSSQLEAEGEFDRLRALYVVGTRITLAICLPLSVTVIVLAGPLLTLWVGREYAQYAPIVIILTLASMLEVSSWPGGTILQGIARHQGFAVTSLCAALANLALSILLVRRFGLVGVAAGTLLPIALFTFGWNTWYCVRTLQVRLRELLTKSYFPVLWPSLVMAAFLLGITRATEPSGLISVASTAAIGLVFFATIYLRFFSGEPERHVLRNAVSTLTRYFFATENR